MGSFATTQGGLLGGPSSVWPSLAGGIGGSMAGGLTAGPSLVQGASLAAAGSTTAYDTGEDEWEEGSKGQLGASTGVSRQQSMREGSKLAVADPLASANAAAADPHGPITTKRLVAFREMLDGKSGWLVVR